MSKLPIDPRRVIEIDELGRFYVEGKSPFLVLPIHNPLEPKRSGFIVIDDTLSFSSDPYELNRLFRMSDNGQLIPVLFKDRDKADAVIIALNRMEL